MLRCPKSTQHQVRGVLQTTLTKILPADSTEDLTAVTLDLATSAMQEEQFPAKKPFNWDISNFPTAYNGRASTIVPSGTPIVRPHGHFLDETAPSEPNPFAFGPSEATD